VGEKYHRLFENAFIGMAFHQIVLDEQGKAVDSVITEINEAFAKQIGLKVADIIGRRISEVIPGIENTSLIEVFEEVALTDEPTQFEEYLEPLQKHYIIDVCRVEESAFATMFQDITVYKQTEHKNSERVKELSAFYYLSTLIEEGESSLEIIYQKMADFLPKSWQYPEITCCKIVYNDKEFQSQNFRDSEWVQSQVIRVHGKNVGSIVVGYLEECTELDEGPFLIEERKLLDALAERIGRITERINAERKIKDVNSLLQSIRDVNQLIVKESDLQALMQGSCEILKQTRDYQNIEIALLDDKTGTIKPVANSGVHFLRDWQLSLDGQGNAPKCIKKCLQSGETITVKDPDKFCASCHYFDEDFKHKGIFIPIKQRENLVGFFSAALLSGHQISQDEIELLEEIAMDIGFAREMFQVEAVLRESEEKFRKVFQKHSAIKLIIDPDNGRILDANEAASRFYGWSVPQLKMMDIYQINTLSPERVKKEMENVRISGKTYFEFKHRKADDSTVDVEVFSSKITINGKKLLHSIIHDISEKKKVEQKLLERENSFRGIFNTVNDSIYILDAKGRFVDVNEGAMKMYGHQKEFFIGKTLEALSAPEKNDMSKITTAQKDTFFEGKPHEFEFWGIRSNEEIFPNDMSLSMGTYLGQKVVIALAHDITERKRREEEHHIIINLLSLLSKPNSQLRMMEEVSQLLKNWSGCDAVGIRLKEGEDFPYYCTSGFSPEFVLKERFLCARDQKEELIRDSQGNPVLECMCGNVICGRLNPELSFFTQKGSFWTNSTTDLLASTTEQDRQSRTRNRCNGEGYESVALVPLKHSGHILGLLQINDSHRNRFDENMIALLERLASNLSIALIQKQTAKALQESEEKFSAAFMSSPAGIAISTLDGKYVDVNDMLCEMLGYSREELIGKTVVDIKIMSASDRENVAKELEVNAGFISNAEIQLHTKDGGTRDLLLSIKPISLHGIPHHLSIGIDITKRKRAEEGLLKAKRAAETANIAKSEFLANMSHELRTPMNAVIGFNEILLETELSDKQRHYAEIVQRSGGALLDIIEDILDFSKIEAGKLELDILDFNLLSLVEGFSETMALRAHNKGLKLFCIVDPDVPLFLRGDPGQLLQILNNLAGNAIKFTSEGKVVIHVSIESQKDGEVKLYFSVTDTGVGIPEDKTKLIFEKFTQADSSTSRRFGGTGLGLAISKQLVEMMGGDIGVRSKVGEGSEFWFSVLLEKQTKANEAEESEHVGLLQKDNNILKILLVEDDMFNQEVAQEMLIQLGYNADIVDNGIEAIKALERIPYDLVLMDIQMPEMDGVKATRLIRSPESNVLNKNIPIIAVTAHAMKGDKERFIEAGMDDYISKPISLKELNGLLDKWNTIIFKKCKH